jgi:hypothetical protein
VNRERGDDESPTASDDAQAALTLGVAHRYREVDAGTGLSTEGAQILRLMAEQESPS